jgi:lactoylglutathione lyase
MPNNIITPIISHIALKVTNLERSTVFYRDTLGLQPIDEPFKIGMHSWFALGAHCQLHLISGGSKIPSFHIDHHLALSTTDLDLFIANLQKDDVAFFDAFKIQGKIHVRPDGIRQVFFQDPDGYWLEMNNDVVNQ